MDTTVRHKKGDVRKDGMVFWYYCKRAKGGEYWVTREHFDRLVEKHRVATNSYGARNRPSMRKKGLAYYYANQEKLSEYSREWFRINKDKALATRKAYRATQRATNPMYRAMDAVRVRLQYAFKGKSKPAKTKALVGCEREELLSHLESQFNNGMSWDNYGSRGWHIDHRIPLASARTEEELVSLCHYTNLQPLWWYDNFKKHAKMPNNCHLTNSSTVVN